MKGFKRILAPQQLNSAVSNRIGQTTVGQQITTSLDAYRGSAAAVNGPVLMGGLDAFDMQAVLGATEPTPATQGNANNVTARTRKMMVKYCHAIYELKNQTNTPIHITLYDCVARRDMQSLIYPETAWTSGMNNESVSIGGNPDAIALNSNLVGVTPFQSQQFCQLWKVKRTSRFELGGGAVHRHAVSIKPGGMLSNEYIRQFQCYKGLSTIVLAVIHGGIADNNPSLTGAVSVSTSTFALDYVTTVQYGFTAMERSRTAYTQYNGLPSTTTIVNVMNDEQDAPTTIAVA